MDWSAQDPLLVGPYVVPDFATTPFDVPSDGQGGFEFLNLSPGNAWPTGVPALERLSAVPALVEASRCTPNTVLVGERSGGEELSLCERQGDSVRWSVNPGAWIDGILRERYVADWNRPLPSLLPLLNYNVVPNVLKGALQPRAALDAARSNALGFPRVPLDDIVESLRALCATLAFGDGPTRHVVWPEGRKAAITVCHDVDTRWILEDAQRGLLTDILAIETGLGLRGAWYIVAKQLDRRRHAKSIQVILDVGHEVGIHGWNHDAKLEFIGSKKQDARMAKAVARFEGLGATGIRTPWYGRGEELMRTLAKHFVYSSSVPNASAFFSKHSNSGCGSVLPFRGSEGLIELPLTVPPDTAGDPADLHAHALRCAEAIYRLGGAIVLTLHPQPHQSGNREGIAAWSSLLGAIEQSCTGDLWKATPSEVVAQYSRVLGGGLPARRGT